MAGYGWRDDEHRQKLLHHPEPVWLDLGMMYPVPDEAAQIVQAEKQGLF